MGDSFENVMMAIAQENLRSGMFDEDPEVEACYEKCRDQYREHQAACGAVFTSHGGMLGDTIALAICRQAARDRLAECLRPFAECNK